MFDFFKTKCLKCGSTAVVDIEVHGQVGHAIHNGLHHAHHAIHRAGHKHPVTVFAGLAVGAALLLTNAIVKKQYKCKDCHHHFTL